MSLPQQRRFSVSVYIAVIVLSFTFIWGALSVQKTDFSKSRLGVLNGEWASSFETHFDENLNHHPYSLSLWNKLNYILFNEGKDGVLVGDDGWLFTTEEFDRPKDFKHNIQDNLNYITRFSYDLRRG